MASLRLDSPWGSRRLPLLDEQARALLEELERGTRAAYEKRPDEPATFDPGEWASHAEAVHPVNAPRRRRAERGTKAGGTRVRRRVAR